MLSGWVVAAAEAAGMCVQSTSIPGVAQRTGATTYYIEMVPRAELEAGTRRPVLALAPFPENVDVVVASELIEAARAMENGYVTAQRTTLIASTHRVYTVAEKSGMADGRFDTQRVRAAADELARQSVLFDMQAAAKTSRSALNAVLLGAVAGSGVLPIAPEHFVAAIENAGIAVAANLRGFALGLESAAAGVGGHAQAADTAAPAAAELPAALERRVQELCPAPTRELVQQAVARLLDYQGPDYAALFLDRLAEIVARDRAAGGGRRGWRLTRETARYLSLRMSYEDVIRVAQLKTRRQRFERVRREAGAGADEPVVISEFLKPGLDELCSVLPARLGRAVVALARRCAVRGGGNVSLRIRSNGITGFLMLRSMAALRSRRPRTLRFAEEQAQVVQWLDAVNAAARIDYDFGVEVAELAGLIKGYGETYRRGQASFERIAAAVVRPALARGRGEALALAQARVAALADPAGGELEQTLGAGAAPPVARDGAAAPSASAAAG